MTEEELESGVIAKRGVRIDRGKGAYIWDSNGYKYLDMGASYGVCNIGHSPERLVESVRSQMENIIYVSSSYDNPVREALMRRLVEISPIHEGRVFLCSSGTEAVEAAVKFALAATNKKRIIAAIGSFHGRTMGSLSLTHNPKYRAGFEDFLGPVDFVRYGDVADMENNIKDETAAVILEPIQGEGGVRTPPDGYLKKVRELCDSREILLIIDEVQTGMCRTGSMFAVDHEGIKPDILCIGKSLGGGFPIAAALLDGSLGQMEKGRHGSTFGGSPIACSAAIAALDIMEEQELSARAMELGDYFMDRLRSIDSTIVREVRGRGLMIGVELKRRAGPYLSALLRDGIAAIPAGSNVIRFLPPLVIGRDDIDHTVEVLTRVLDEG
ncbi:MAG: aspartate aminotransferase family protein [Thermoplasmatota archaeon]